jgi:LysM repeat protein
MSLLDSGDSYNKMKSKSPFLYLIILGCTLAGCTQTPVDVRPSAIPTNGEEVKPNPTPTIDPVPGELVDYIVQSGDTLFTIAAHFNTTTDEILQVNPDVPREMTTLPPGLPLTIPAYLLPLASSSFQVIPDSEVVYSPSAIDFDIAAEIQSRPGYLKSMGDYLYKHSRTAAEVIEFVAQEYSIHPRLLLTLLEFQSNALSNPSPSQVERTFPLGAEDQLFRGLYWQLSWAASRINDGYYGWRMGVLEQFSVSDGHILRPNPWLNAGTIGLYNLFSELYGLDDLALIMSPEGFQRTYLGLWGDPFEQAIDLFPANLQQPEVGLPFEPNVIWDFSAGPHFSWGSSLPLGALDFAPPAVEGGCAQSDVWIASPIAGEIVRSENSTVVLDLDNDGDERTGWIFLFFHVEKRDQIASGTIVQTGDKIGHPSCEGGRSTGTHFHIARRYNGEWLPAAGTLPFVLDDWVVEYGEEPYLGTMRKGSNIVEACTCTTSANRIIYEFP